MAIATATTDKVRARRKIDFSAPIFYLVALILWGVAIREVRLEWWAPLALLPVALHLFGQVATLKPEDGTDALAKFRSNRFAGLLMFAACWVVGTA